MENPATHLFAGGGDAVLEEGDAPAPFLIPSQATLLDHDVVDASSRSLFF